MLFDKVENQGVARALHSAHGVLGDEPVLIFDLDGQVLIPERRCGLIQNGGQLAGGDSVIIIPSYPSLELAGARFVPRPSAIDEGFLHARHLCDVEGDRNEAAAGKQDLEREGGLIGQEVLEFLGVHKRVIFMRRPWLQGRGLCGF